VAASDQLIARDAVLRQAAFDHVRELQARDPILSHEAIRQGFLFKGDRWPLWNPQRGIFKPREMPFLLSVRTVVPRKGGRIWYDDQRRVHQQIFAGNEELDYAFMGTDPTAPDNAWLREAAERQIPLIYFLGVSPGRYQAIIPTFVVDWDARGLRARLAFGELAGATAAARAPDAAERRYALRLVKQRLHQAAFRDGVLAAYDHRCAISNLPEAPLLDAAHIMADAHELLGQPVLAKGIALSKIHHAAFDNHLIGIDPDGRVHVSERLLMLHDGPLLEQSLKAIEGTTIRLPRSSEHRPDRDRLAARFDLFKRVA
jgi:putative restriction endonuclease